MMWIGRRSWVCVGVVLAVACGEPPRQASQESRVEDEGFEEAAAMIDAELERVGGAEAASFPCSLFTSEQLTAVVGAPVGSGSYAFVNRSEDDHEWQSPSCTWLGPDEEGAEISVWVSRPEHFSAGVPECHPLVGYGIRELRGIGSSATWGFGANEDRARGTLRVCSPQALLEVVLDLPAAGGEDRMLRAARDVADRALADSGSASTGGAR